jgi:hypothetical protein
MVKTLSDLHLYRQTPLLVLFTLCAALACPGAATGLESARTSMSLIMTPAHYGQGLSREHGVVSALKPRNTVALVHAFGYHAFTLREQDLVYSVSGSVGSILAHVEYANTPLPVPESVLVQTTAEVFDLTAGGPLGTFHHALDEGLPPVTPPLPGRSYRLTFSAPGHEPVEQVEALPDADPFEVSVTLNRRVPQSARSWGEMKARFR